MRWKCENTGFNSITIGESIMTVIQAKVPDQLALQAQRMIERGWALDIDTIVTESLRRYLESHEETLTEQFVREDVEWGLRGND
jgi:hypothetical protein